MRHAILTVDDAPSANMREKVDLLNRLDLRAVWFCTGELLRNAPDDACYAVERGHVVANHAYTHPYFSELSAEHAIGEIDDGQSEVERVYERVGLAAPRYFRFPYGDTGLHGIAAEYEDGAEPTDAGRERHDAIMQHLKRNRFEGPITLSVTHDWFAAAGADFHWPWTFDCKEYELSGSQRPAPSGVATLDDVLERIDRDDPDEGFRLNSGHSDEIVLIHDHAETSPYFAPIVERIRSKAFKFVLPL